MGTSYVGSFQVVNSSGPQTQVVSHGLGMVPKAMIIFSTTCDAVGFRDGNFKCLGFVDQDRNSYCQTSFDYDAVSSGGDYSYRFSAGALEVVTTALYYSATISAWDASTFTLNWATLNSSTGWVGYILLGGQNVRSKVTEYTITAGTGSKAVTGAGFQPQLVLNMLGQFSGALPRSVYGTAVSHFNLGATDGTRDWAVASRGVDNGVLTDTHSTIYNNSCIFGFRDAADSVTHVIGLKASITSLDSDGATFNFTNNEYQANGGRIFFLWIAGLDNVRVDTFNKSTGAATASQDVTSPNFRPEAVLLCGVHKDNTTVNLNDSTADSFIGIGAFDTAREVSMGGTSDFGIGTSNTSGYASTTKAWTKVENHTKAVDAEADGSMLSNGFNLSWTTNDTGSDDDDYICYIAFDCPPGGGPGGPGPGKKPPKGQSGTDHWPISLGHEGEEVF